MMEEEKLIRELENKYDDLLARIEKLEQRENDEWLLPAELAKRLKCSVTTVYRKINNGEIYATRKAGDPRIPLSQFYIEKNPEINNEENVIKFTRQKKAKCKDDIKSLVFG